MSTLRLVLSLLLPHSASGAPVYCACRRVGPLKSPIRSCPLPIAIYPLLRRRLRTRRGCFSGSTIALGYSAPIAADVDRTRVLILYPRRMSARSVFLALTSGITMASVAGLAPITCTFLLTIVLVRSWRRSPPWRPMCVLAARTDHHIQCIISLGLPYLWIVSDDEYVTYRSTSLSEVFHVV